MPFLVQGCIDDQTLVVTTATAKEAFAKAIEWQVVQRFTDVSNYDGIKRCGSVVTDDSGQRFR